MCRSMRHLRPETGGSLVICFKTLIQLYLLYLFIYSLTYCIKEGINGNIFGHKIKKVLAYEAATA